MASFKRIVLFLAATVAIAGCHALAQGGIPTTDADAASTPLQAGQVALAKGDLQGAEKSFLEAVQLFEKSPDSSLDLASAYSGLGTVTLKQSRLDDSAQWYQKGLAILAKEEFGSMDLARCYEGLGTIAYLKNDLASAEEYFKKTVSVEEEIVPDTLDLASSYSKLGVISYERGDLQAAEDIDKKALAIRETEEPGSLEVAASDNNLGDVAIAKGDLEAAEAWHKKALEIRKAKAPDSIDLATSYANLGVIRRYRGDLEAAESWFQKALAIKQAKAPGSLDLANILLDLGDVAFARGDLDTAEAWFEKAQAIQEVKAPGSLALAYSYNNIGAVALDRGDAKTAGEWHKKAMAIRESLAPGSLDLATSYDNMGAVADAGNDLKAGQDWHLKAARIKEAKAPGSLDLAATYDSLGADAYELGDKDPAEAWYRKALTIQELKAPGSLDLARTYKSLGRLLESASRYAEAKDVFDQADSIEESQRSKLLDPQSRQLFSRQFESGLAERLDALVHLGDLREAVGLLESSKSRGLVEAISSRKIPLSTPEIKELDNELDMAYSDLSRERTADKTKVLRDRISELLVQKRAAENDFRKKDPRLASFAYPSPLDLAGVQGVVGKGALVLHYVVGEDYTYLFAVASADDLPAQGTGVAGVRAYRIEIKESDLADKVSAFTGDLSTGVASPQFGPDLFDILVKPALPLIQSSPFRRLLVCPNGPLNTLPFAALPSGPNSYLIDALPITTISSVTVLDQIRKENRRSASVTVLALGDPAYPRGGSLVRLPSTGDEAEAVASLYGAKPLVGEKATVSALLSDAGNARIIHIACHGLVNAAEPMASSLALTPVNGSDGMLHAFDVMQDLHLSADLVVLSACKTGLGKSEGNEGVDGLTRAFQFAGAKSVVVSLWSVDDDATSEFMRLFHLGLKSGQERDIALQRAEIELRKTYPLPFYWAPFILSGDWE